MGIRRTPTSRNRRRNEGRVGWGRLFRGQFPRGLLHAFELVFAAEVGVVDGLQPVGFLQERLPLAAAPGALGISSMPFGIVAVESEVPLEGALDILPYLRFKP